MVYFIVFNFTRTILPHFFHLFVGISCGALLTRFSLRQVTILGSLLLAAGIILNANSPHIIVLYAANVMIGMSRTKKKVNRTL